MVAPFDVPGRMAEGRPAVDTVAQYVWASHQLGYQHPDLTVHAGQLRDWYGAEDGMNLSALQQDCGALDAAVRAADEALAVQERQLAALPDAWQGAGAQASQEFLHRHGVASADAAHAVRTAAEALRRVSEQLWRAVDGKVDAVVAVEADVGAARTDWLAASATVMSGVGDRAAAAELVDTAVKPFVDSRIRTDWLAGVKAAGAAIADAYQGATAEIRAASHAVFAIPGDLGPSAPPPRRHEVAAPAPGPTSVPTAAPAPGASTPTMPSAWQPPAAPPPAPPPPPVPPPAPAPMTSPLSDLGAGGLGGGGLGGGLGGGALPAVGQRFADALSGLLGGGAGDADLEPPDLEPPDLEPPDLEPPDLEEDTEDDEEEPDDDPEDDEEDTDAEDPPDEEATAEEPPVEEAAEGVPEPVPPVEPPAPPPPPPPAEALPPLDDEQTPCAIAADEVPQVGEPAG